MLSAKTSHERFSASSQNERQVSDEMAQEAAALMHTRYFVTSAKTHTNTAEPFHECVRVIRAAAAARVERPRQIRRCVCTL